MLPLSVFFMMKLLNVSVKLEACNLTKSKLVFAINNIVCLIIFIVENYFEKYEF